MGKVSGRVAIKADALYAQALQEPWHDDSANGVDGIHNHGELGGLDGLHIHCGKRKDGIQVLVREVFFLNLAKVVYFGKAEVLFFGEVKNGLALNGSEEFTFVIEKLEGVPLPGIVAGGEDDSAVCVSKKHRHFRGGSGGETAFNYVYSAADESSNHKLLHHVSGHAGILAHHNFVAVPVGLGLALRKGGSICRRKFHNVNGGEGAAGLPADCSANAGN